MEVPLARFLTRFSIEDEDDSEPLVESESEPVAVPDPLETRLAAALAEVEARHKEQLSFLRAKLESEATEALTQARAEWCESQGAKLMDRIGEAMPELRTYVADRIADALAPLVAKSAVERARAALLESLDILLADETHSVITLKGPDDLVEAMRKARPDAKGLRYVTHDDIDAVITADGLTIQTCLEEALSALAESGD